MGGGRHCCGKKTDRAKHKITGVTLLDLRTYYQIGSQSEQDSEQLGLCEDMCFIALPWHGNHQAKETPSFNDERYFKR